MSGAKRLALLLALAASPVTAADLKANPQIWGEIDLSANIAPEWRVTAMAVDRVGDGLPNPTLWGGGAIVDRKFGTLTISAGDLEVVARSPVSGASLAVHVPLAALSYDWKVAGFIVSDRSRVEDLVGVRTNPWRYRNRLSADHPIQGMRPLSAVFASEEVFYDFGTRHWTRSRAQVGLGLAAARNAEVRVYYLRQDQRSSLPRAVNGLGMTVALELE
jgi:hypothetical protein